MKIIKIKNLQSVADVYCGMTIEPSEYYTLQSDQEISSFAIDEKVNQHLWSIPAKILINDGSADLSSVLGDSYLKGISPKDEDGFPVFTNKMVDGYDRPQFRRIVTRPTWLYCPRSIDWITSKYLSLYNRKHDGNLIDDGTDIGDAWLQFYDANGIELTIGSEESVNDFQTRIEANCVKTTMSFEKITSYDIQAALLYLQNEPENRAYLWCIFAPDVPEAYGGSKALMGGGMNLQMLAKKVPHVFDAVSANTIDYDSTYHSGKLTAFIKHTVGAKIGIQIVFINYNE